MVVTLLVLLVQLGCLVVVVAVVVGGGASVIVGSPSSSHDHRSDSALPSSAPTSAGESKRRTGRAFGMYGEGRRRGVRGGFGILEVGLGGGF